jgi:hypothetical protein
MENNNKRKRYILVLGTIGVILGWFFLANIEQMARILLGCGYQLAPSPSGQPGPCLGTSFAQRAVIQIAGMALCTGGVLAIVISLVNYYGRNQR